MNHRNFRVVTGTKGVARDLTKNMCFFPYQIYSDCVFEEQEFRGTVDGYKEKQYLFLRGMTEYTVPASAVKVMNG